MADNKSAYEYFLEALSDYPEVPDTSNKETKAVSTYDKLLEAINDLPEVPEAPIEYSPTIRDTILDTMQETKTVGGATGTLFDDIARPVATALHAVQDGITNMFSSDIRTADNYDLSDSEQVIYGIGQNIPRWGMTAGLAAGSAMTGGALSAGLGVLTRGSILLDTVTGGREVYKGIYEDALSRGLSEEDAKNSAAWGTAMSMPFEYLGDRYIGKAFSKASAKRIEKKLIASGAAERVANGKGVRIVDEQLANTIVEQEAAGMRKTAGLLPAPEGEVAEETSNFISLNALKEKLPINEAVDKIKGKLPTKEEWEALKTKITDSEIIQKFKGKIPTKEEWETLKTKLKDSEVLSKIKEKLPSRETWEEFTNKIKGRVPTKEEWEALKTKLKDSDLVNKIKGKVPTKEEWETIVEKLKGKIPTKEELKAFTDNSAFSKSLVDSYNKTKQFTKDTMATISAKKAEFMAARRAAQKANLHIKNPELFQKILKEAEEGRNWRDLLESAVIEGTTEGIQGRLENLGVYKNDPNMKLEDIFEGTAEDILLGAGAAGVLHGIAKGIGRSPIGKFSSRRIAEMHRRRFDMGDVFNDLTTSNNVANDSQRDFQDDFYKAHAVFDADTGERVDWDNLKDDGRYNITYQDSYAARNISEEQVKKYAEKIVKLRVDPETKSVVIPADIEYKDAPGTLTVSEDGTTTITPDYDSLSEDPIKAEEQAVEQTENTRAAIMRDEGVSEEDVERQSPMPGAANRKTFGKLSEGSDIQNDITDKPDTVESEDSEDSSSYFITRKVDEETNKLLTDHRLGKPKKGLVSKNHVLSTIVKFAKKALDVNLDTTLDTEGFRREKGKMLPEKSDVLGKTNPILSLVNLRNASNGMIALHELGHYLFQRGRRLTRTGFGNRIDPFNNPNDTEFDIHKNVFDAEMKNLWSNGYPPQTKASSKNPATNTIDPWTSNESELDLNNPEYKEEEKPEEIFVETFARYVANQNNFRKIFKKYAPKTYKAFQKYLTEHNLHKYIDDINVVWNMYASQNAETRLSADSSRTKPTRWQKLYDYIQKFFGDRQHLATVLSKTIDNVAGFRHINKELGDTKYAESDRFERIRGQVLSAVDAFISGKGIRWGGSDLFGTRFRNYDSIISDVQKLNNITDTAGNTLTGVQRFDAYLAAKNTVGETIGNTVTMRTVEKMAKDLGQTVRQTQADIIAIKRDANYDWSNSKYAPYQGFIEQRVRAEGQWVQTQATLSQAWDTIENEEKQADFNKLQKAFNDYQYLWKSVQDFVSAMSPSMAAYVNALRLGGAAYYTPLMREILQNPNNYNAIITHREGSDRPAYSSLENTPAELRALMNAGLRAYTKDMLVKMAAMPDSGVYIHEVRPPVDAISMAKVKDAIKDAALQQLPPGTALPQDLLDALSVITVGTIYISNPNADVTDNVFSVVTINNKGKAELRFFKTEEALLTMLDANNDTDGTTNQVLQLLDYFNKFEKDLFTRYNLRFVLYKNQLRDAFSASLKGNRLLFRTGNKFIDNNWLNSIAGSLQGMASVYMMWMTNPQQWEQWEDAMSAIGMSTNKIQNEYNAILSRTKPSVKTPQGQIGFLTDPKFKKFLQRMDQSDMIVRISELEALLKQLNTDKEELYLSKDRVGALALSKNKLESLGLTFNMVEQILTDDQRTMWNNTDSAATLTLNLTPQQIKQVLQVVKQNNVRTERNLTEEQIDMLNREVALCTTDFIRHGKWSDKLNRFMLFSKAGINGTAQYGTWYDRRKMQGRSGEVYGRIVSMAIAGWLLTSMFGDDDEDEEETWNGIRLRLGDSTIDIPVLPEDLLGWNMGRALAHGDVNGTFVKHFAAAINPIKSAGFGALVADVLSDKKISRVGWDDFAQPIVPPYLKQKYGNELDKIVTYNTGMVAKALPNIFGMTPAHWQYVLNNSGIGGLIKDVENALGVDKSVLLPDGSVLPTGQGSLSYALQQVGINRPLYRTRYERKLDELFKEATSDYSISPNDEEAKSRYLLLYNAVHLQQNLNKLKFYATTDDQRRRLVTLCGATAKNSLEAITGGDADLYKLRAANRSAKAAIEATQAQLKETGEGTPATAYEKALEETPVKRPRKKEASSDSTEEEPSTLSKLGKTVWENTLGTPEAKADALPKTPVEHRSHPVTAYVETSSDNEDDAFGSIKNGRVGPNHLMGHDLVEFTKYISGGKRETPTKDKTGMYVEYDYKANPDFTKLSNKNSIVKGFVADTIADTKKASYEEAYKELQKQPWFRDAYREFTYKKYNAKKDIPSNFADNDAIQQMGYSIKNHAGSHSKIISNIKNPSTDAKTYLRQMYDAVDTAFDSRVASAKQRHLVEYYLFSAYLKHLQDNPSLQYDLGALSREIRDYQMLAKADSNNPLKKKVNGKYVLKTADDIEKEVWGGKL